MVGTKHIPARLPFFLRNDSMLVVMTKEALVGERVHAAGEAVEVAEDRGKALIAEGVAQEGELDAEHVALVKAATVPKGRKAKN
jgi:hypothetical protein